MDDLLRTQAVLLDQLLVIKRNFDKTPVARRTRGYTSKKIESTDAIWKHVQQNDTALRTFKDYAGSNYALDGAYDEAEESYSSFSGDLCDVIHNLDRAEVIPAIQNHPQPHNPPPANNPNPNHAFRLPQITLPTFSGDYSTWSAFHDMFISLIHNNATLNDVQKLHYLKCNLRDDAAHLLRHIQVTNENYEVAWDTLTSRYANKKILVDTQLKSLINQPSCQHETARSIRDMIDATQDSINALRVLEIDVSMWDPLLLFVLVQKLSKETHVAWEQNQEGEADLPTYADFISFLENRFRMLESLASRTLCSSTHKPVSRQMKSHAAIASSTNLCPICSNQHYIRSCPTFLQMSIPDRRGSLKHHRVCYNCLVPGHQVSECRNRTNCQKCNKRHHTLVHETNSNQPRSSASTSSQQSSTSDSPAPAAQLAATVNQIATPRCSNVPVVSHIAAPSTTSSPARYC